MPDLESFEKGFNLIKGNNYAGYILMDIKGIHEPIIKYKEYKYHITLIYGFENPQMSEEEFFNNHVFEDRQINTHYGNPYMCKLFKVNKEETVNNKTGFKELKIVLEGESHRM